MFKIGKNIMSNRMDPNPKKYGYARVSSKSQEANSSLESQKQELVQNLLTIFIQK